MSFVFIGGIVAVVFGLVARAQAGRAAPGRTRAMATIGAVLGALSLVLGTVIVVAIVGIVRTDRSLTTLRRGDCFDTVHGLLPHYHLHSCGGPHQMEVAGTFSDPAASGDPWPGLSGFGTDQPACAAAIGTYVGGTFDPARYRPYTLVPSERQWNLGTRRIVCVIQDPGGGALVGSARGSGTGGASSPAA
jgi:Septum formation